MVSTESLDMALGKDVRLIALDLAGRSIASHSLRDDLAAIAGRFPEVPIALLASTDDALMASQALQMGIRGFFTTSIPIEVALAGLRLVLAGGIFCPHPLGALASHSEGQIKAQSGSEKVTADRTHHTEFTPREAAVLAELQCGCSNKVIAGKLNLSDHTVKMHLQHIMRKLQVQNRTEVVARLGSTAFNGQDIGDLATPDPWTLSQASR
ncbi:DNA-binding NarL/FixJ family response regulator [Rhizobium sp. BK251]|nr:DNA-binding NarL/FixJ family response regulator [Rhizobium sp. BK251]